MKEYAVVLMCLRLCYWNAKAKKIRDQKFNVNLNCMEIHVTERERDREEGGIDLFHSSDISLSYKERKY